MAAQQGCFGLPGAAEGDKTPFQRGVLSGHHGQRDMRGGTQAGYADAQLAGIFTRGGEEVVQVVPGRIRSRYQQGGRLAESQNGSHVPQRMVGNGVSVRDEDERVGDAGCQARAVRSGFRQFRHGRHAAASRRIEGCRRPAEFLFRFPKQRAHDGIQSTSGREGDGNFHRTGRIARIGSGSPRGKCRKDQKDEKDRKRRPVKAVGKAEGRDEGKVTIRFHVTHYAEQV